MKLLKQRRLLSRGASIALAFGCVSCLGLSDQEKEMLIVHQQNSKVYYDQGNMARAEQHCRLGLELEPDDRTLRLTLAYVLLKRADPESLEESLQYLDSLDSWFGGEDFRVLLGKGIALQSQARLALESGSSEASDLFEEARDRLEDSLELEADNIEAVFHLSLLDLEQNNVEKFWSHSEHTLSLVEKSVRMKAKLLERIEGERQRSAMIRDRVVDQQRGRRLRELRAELAFRQGNHDEALQEMSGLEALDAFARPHYFNRAMIHQARGDLEEAVQDYERFIELSDAGIDANVQVAVENLYDLRAELAEQRVASQDRPS